jgi:hypothetical protein
MTHRSAPRAFPLLWALAGAAAAALVATLIFLLLEPPRTAEPETPAAAFAGDQGAPGDPANRQDALRANLEREAILRQQFEREDAALLAAETERAALHQRRCEAGDADACHSYLEQYPDGPFAGAAAAKIEALAKAP